jgi:hypothetical protein
MSSGTDRLQTNDDQRLAAESAPASDRLSTTVGRWLWISGYQGLAQVFLLSAPVLWLVFRSPRAASFLKPAVLVLAVVTPLVVGAFREGHLSAGRPWPAITSDRLSFAGGYWAVFRRGVLLNHTLGVATYGGAAVGLLVGSLSATIGVAVALAFGGVALVPWLTPETTRAAIGRLCFAAASLTLALFVGAPFAGDPRFRTAPAGFALLVGLSVIDLRPWASLAALRRE